MSGRCESARELSHALSHDMRSAQQRRRFGAIGGIERAEQSRHHAQYAPCIGEAPPCPCRAGAPSAAGRRRAGAGFGSEENGRQTTGHAREAAASGPFWPVSPRPSQFGARRPRELARGRRAPPRGVPLRRVRVGGAHVAGAPYGDRPGTATTTSVSRPRLRSRGRAAPSWLKDRSTARAPAPSTDRSRRRSGRDAGAELGAGRTGDVTC
jgi:hypothetical protein